MKYKNIIFIIVLVFHFIISICFSQSRVGEWEALTSVIEVNDVNIVGDVVYAATEGGIFEIRDKQYSVHTTIDGLIGVDLSTITVDSSSLLWIGGDEPFGFLQIYDPINNKSINHFDFGLSAILDIQIINNFCWVLFRKGQEYGIMKFIYDGEWQYRDSYNNFPITSGNINCFSANESTLFLGMTGGIYTSNIDNNMKDPNSWSQLITNFSYDVSSMDLDEDYLRFTTSSNIFEFSISNNELTQIQFSFELQDAKNLFYTDTGMWFDDGDKLFLKTDLNDYLIWDRYDISGFDYSNGQLVAGSKTGFIFCNRDNNSYDISRFLPNSPVTANFSSITILDDGRLVGGSGQGISIYNGQGWRNILEIKESGTLVINNEIDYNNFIADTVAYDFGEYVADMEQGPDGLLYCAIRGSRVYSGNPPRWSGGVIILDVDDPANISTIDTTFLSYHTSSSNSIPYQVTLDVEFDSYGNLWILNPYCINGNNPVHVRSTSGIWKHYGSSETSTRISQSPCSIVFDAWNRAWLSAFQADEANLGIYPNGGISVLSYQGQPYAPSDFSWNVIEYSGTVWSLGYGINNRLYYLTPSGLNYYDVDNNNLNPILRENSYPYFPNISFGSGSGISVDINGNIWTYSPTQGIHILLENTSYWPDINGFRADNYPLLSDEVRDIDFDSDRNLAYIATSKGVNILRIPFGNPKIDFDKVKLFPNPFYIPSRKPMKVDGIIYGSSMMITTLDGRVIRHIRTNGMVKDGDQLSWDGKDLNGDYVSTGVYLVLLYDNNGSRYEYKITVIKQ